MRKEICSFIALSALLLLASCGAFKSYTASYSFVLDSVESPENAKQQFGNTKVVSFVDGTLNKYRYEDDYINIVWYVSQKQFNFELKNKSGHSLKINWDDISYVDYNGKAGRVMHAGVKYTERNNSQPSTTIPKGADLSDILLPTDNVYYISPSTYSSGGWEEKYLLPCVYSKPEDRAANAGNYVGKTLKIMMPIMIENVQNDYTFTFNIDRLLDFVD